MEKCLENVKDLYNARQYLLEHSTASTTYLMVSFNDY